MSCVLVAGLAGCSLFGPDPQDRFAAFADALQRRDAAAAAEQTDDPDTAKATIDGMFAGMGQAASVIVTVTGAATPAHNDETSTLGYHWSFGNGREFRYDTSATAIRNGDDWRIAWAPTLLHRDLTPGINFQFSQDADLLTPIVDRTGQPLMTWQNVGAVTLERVHLNYAPDLAAVLSRFDPVTPEWIAQQFDSTTEPAVTVMRLRESDLAQVSDQLTQIPGVSVREQGDLLTANPELSSPAIGELPNVWHDWINKSAGWSVSLVDRSGAPSEELVWTPHGPTEPLRTMLDLRLQLLAQQAVATETLPTVLVAISGSSGGILAAAQNDAADAQGPLAFSGLYPPGSTFKTITTAAALQADLVHPDTPVACPGRLTIENRTIPNNDEFDLGTVPMSTAFARSCNTTMGALADRLPPNALTDTARDFGIGVDYVVPGLTTVTGRVPNADTPAQRVENGIGQGSVTVTPFGLAVAEASLAHGSTITPSLIDGEKTTADTPPVQLPPNIVDDLRAMMRLTVTEGTASALSDIDGLGGKTGTAEFGDNTHSHGWFAGIAGDIAFATLVVGGDTSAPAISVSGEFLRQALAG